MFSVGRPLFIFVWVLSSFWPGLVHASNCDLGLFYLSKEQKLAVSKSISEAVVLIKRDGQVGAAFRRLESVRRFYHPDLVRFYVGSIPLILTVYPEYQRSIKEAYLALRETERGLTQLWMTGERHQNIDPAWEESIYDLNKMRVYFDDQDALETAKIIQRSRLHIGILLWADQLSASYQYLRQAWMGDEGEDEMLARGASRDLIHWVEEDIYSNSLLLNRFARLMMQMAYHQIRYLQYPSLGAYSWLARGVGSLESDFYDGPVVEIDELGDMVDQFLGVSISQGTHSPAEDLYQLQHKMPSIAWRTILEQFKDEPDLVNLAAVRGGEPVRTPWQRVNEDWFVDMERDLEAFFREHPYPLWLLPPVLPERNP